MASLAAELLASDSRAAPVSADSSKFCGDGTATGPATAVGRNVGGVALPRFAVVDVETSGLRPRRHHLLQIGLVDRRGRRVRWSTGGRHWCELRRSWHRVGPHDVHGIRRRDLRDAPVTRDALGRAPASRLDGAVFTAHNAKFDAEFIERAAEGSRVPLRIERRLCTLDLSRRLDPDRRSPTASPTSAPATACRSTDHHDALADAVGDRGGAPVPAPRSRHHESSQLDELYFPRRRGRGR